AKLIPMFLLGKSKKTRLLYAALILQNVGLILFLADGYFNPIGLRTLLYGLLVAAGTVCWLLYIIDAYKHRARKKIDLLMKHAGLSSLCLSFAFLCIPIVLISSQTKWASLYGSLLFLGWITGIILGKTFKTLPSSVWSSRYETLCAETTLPVPTDLYGSKLLPYQYSLSFVALAMLCLGTLLDPSCL